MARYESFEEDLRAGDPRDDFLGRGSGRSSPGLVDTADDVEPDVSPLALPSGTWTLLDIVEKCDNASLPAWPPRSQAAPSPNDGEDEEHLTPFFVKDGDSLPIGFLRPTVLQALLDDNEAATSKMKMAEPCWKILKSRSSIPQQDGNDSSDDGQITGVAFNDWLNEEGKEARCDHLDRLVRGWKQRGLFSEELGGWRNEQYPIYGPKLSQDDPNFSPLPGANTAFTLERSACSIFGFSTYGVHMTAFVRKENKYLFWVPKRSATKQTWPSYLDNSVAGGITAGDGPLETIVRECAEEASLPPAFVRKRIRAAGAISYVYKNKAGWLQPETQYIYDLEMPVPPEGAAALDLETPENGDPVVLRPNDGEAESFSLMPAEEVLERMIKGEFKPNCALVLVDFFIRHGLLTAETDVKYLEIIQRLKRSLYPLPGPA